MQLGQLQPRQSEPKFQQKSSCTVTQLHEFHMISYNSLIEFTQVFYFGRTDAKSSSSSSSSGWLGSESGSIEVKQSFTFFHILSFFLSFIQRRKQIFIYNLIY